MKEDCVFQSFNVTGNFQMGEVFDYVAGVSKIFLKLKKWPLKLRQMVQNSQFRRYFQLLP